MARRAVITDTNKRHLSNNERQQRNAIEAELRIGSIKDYHPSGLDDYGLEVYDAILAAIPENKLSTVDGYSIERAAANLSDVNKIEQLIERTGLAQAISSGKLWNAKHKAEEQARKWLIELGCSPSARAKIAGDIAAKAGKPKTIRELLEDPEDV